ncbi:Bug family tripartite tricarboxylate transporter substrate binding protein [Pseudooceanicola nanhaiensis]|uniref:Bug family tripartite tricarboxylate transporter substrate binding protein n=1 Tax=Pseudooceanicola nanhaiensis TaxID=375761 RepID=UPI001CD42ACC|nr:tripartite tricarboxylate transporter substrate binding protein [Pseudooceanicola nanhaiensis]MCA0920401.1 tripartite tricarboxylate transporter substrate binding protein [Pseudooceanicola nanhaiensis]
MTFLSKAAGIAAVSLALVGAPALAEGFPDRPMEFVAGYGPGGGHDTMLRTMARLMEQENIVDVPINVVNKEGGSSAVAMGYLNARKESPYYLMSITSSHIATPLTSNIGLNYADFTPIARIGIDPELLVVNTAKGYESLADLKAEGRMLNVGGTATGSIEHIVTMQLAEKTGMELNFIPFQGDGEVVTALLSNQIDFAITNPGPVSDYLSSDKFKALAISTEERIDSLPDVPTFSEQGADIKISLFRGLTAAPGISDEERDALIAMVTKLFETEAWQKEYIEPNAVVPLVVTGQEFTDYLAETEAVYRETLGDLGMLGN